MRALIATDAIGAWSSAQAGTILGRAWAQLGAQVALVPMAAGGTQLEAALAGWPEAGRVFDLRRELPGELPEGAIGVVDPDQLHLPLTGLQGLAAVSGRQRGADLAEVLAEDAKLSRWAASLWPSNPDAATIPGGGAHQGAGLRVLAAGGRLSTGAALCAEAAQLAASARLCDVVVTGCTRLDFDSFGGEVVTEVVRIAQAALRPVVVVAAENYVSARELRTVGIEAAYAAGPDPDETKLAALASRVAATWSW